MPHFVIDCTEKILKGKSPKEILKKVHQVADSTSLFNTKDIKVRMNPFVHAIVGGEFDRDFVHVFATIMEGRSNEQKNNLSNKIVGCLAEIFPNSSVVSVHISEIDKNTYTIKYGNT